MKLKKIFLSFVVLVSIGSHATTINRQQAAKLAREFMSEKFSSSSARRAAQTVPLNQVETGQSLVYAFNVEGGGFVVVAGDDCAPAILGFSETSAIDPADMPEGMKDLFAQYQEEMQLMMLNGQRAATISNLGEEIEPLIESRWGQGAPYNYMCPRYTRKDSPILARSATGCSATAMSQILYYHKHPAEIAEIPGEYYNPRKKGNVPQPDLTKTLEWGKMLTTYGTRKKVGGTQEQQDAVAKLHRLVGQSICMEYTPERSGASIRAAYTSFVNYFKYDATTIKMVQRVDYTYTDWLKLMYEEVKAKRPVYYIGNSVSGGGHAYVVHGYKAEDFFYINWGWYDEKSLAFRLSLCNSSESYESGGTGTPKYAASQAAIIGIQPTTTPSKIEPVFKGYTHWVNKDTYTRESASEDFDLTKGFTMTIENCTHYEGSFSFGAIVKDEAGKRVQELLPLSDDTKDLTVKPGCSASMYKYPKKVGAGLGNGTYTLEFLYRIGEGEWKSFYSSGWAKFKIDGNTLTIDACPDWLKASMVASKLENAEKPSYSVAVRLENTSTDKHYYRSLKLGRDTKWRNTEKKRIAVTLEPGEVKNITMLYEQEKYTPKKLYLVALEDGSPICNATIEEGGTRGEPDFSIEYNVTAELKKQADESYVLKTDDDYEVVCDITNNGTGDYVGYIELTDSIKDTYFNTDFELEDSKGELLTLKAGETKQLTMTITNDYDADLVHKLGVITYTDDGDPINLDNTEEFTMRPVYDLRFTDFDVTPKEEVDDEYADYIVKGNKATVSGKIQNTENTDFEGTIIIKRYTTDFSQEMEIDEDGDYNIDCDRIFMTDVKIPANGTYNYSQEFDLQGLVSSTNYNVFMDFEISYMRNLSGDEVPLYFSSSYLLNDATSTGISIVKSSQSTSQNYYDLQGRKLNGKPRKGLYIHQGRKYLNK